jgi:hypothetical protein
LVALDRRRPSPPGRSPGSAPPVTGSGPPPGSSRPRWPGCGRHFSPLLQGRPSAVEAGWPQIPARQTSCPDAQGRAAVSPARPAQGSPSASIFSGGLAAAF